MQKLVGGAEEIMASFVDLGANYISSHDGAALALPPGSSEKASFSKKAVQWSHPR